MNDSITLEAGYRYLAVDYDDSSFKFDGAMHRRQMAAVRKEIDHVYEAQTGLAKQASKAQPADNLSSSSRT